MKSRGTALIAGWSSPVARQAHNLKVVGSNPAPATKQKKASRKVGFFLFGIDVAFFWRGKVWGKMLVKGEKWGKAIKCGEICLAGLKSEVRKWKNRERGRGGKLRARRCGKLGVRWMLCVEGEAQEKGCRCAVKGENWVI